MFGTTFIALLGLALFLPAWSSGEDETGEPNRDDDVSYGDSVQGTDGADTFTRDPSIGSDDTLGSATIEAGAGDDTISLFDPNADAVSSADPFQYSFSGASIDGGDGDDLIDVFATESRIDGGEGDDTITVHENGLATTVLGGAGDDVLTGAQNDGDVATFDGGDGNDMLDIRNMQNVFARGGAGNDVILVSGVADGGAGYVPSADGGAGDDTLSYEGGGITGPDRFGPVALTGGSGADTFALDLHEGGAIVSDEPLTNDGAYQLSAVDLADFDSSEDMLVVDTTATSDTYTYSGASLQSADAQAGDSTTQLVLHYEGNGEPDRDVIVDLGDVEITLADISFIGAGQAGGFQATSGSDTLSDADFAGSTAPDLIDMGAGNDSVTLEATAFDSLLGNDGDDTLSAGGEDNGFVNGAVIDGGAGDDALTAAGDEVTLRGGEGNDVLSTLSPDGGIYADTFELDGGEGNDTINLENAFNSNALGGAGDDVINVLGFSTPSAGSTIAADGEAGNDTINFVADEAFIPDIDSGALLSGGEGADVFNLTLDGGLDVTSFDPLTEINLPMAVLEDFDPSEDTLVVTHLSSDESITFATAALREGLGADGAPATQLVLTFEDAGGLDREVIVTLGDIEITLADITIVDGTAA